MVVLVTGRGAGGKPVGVWGGGGGGGGGGDHLFTDWHFTNFHL